MGRGAPRPFIDKKTFLNILWNILENYPMKYPPPSPHLQWRNHSRGVILRQCLKLIWCWGKTERASGDGSKKRKFILSFVFVLYCFQLYLYWDQKSANLYTLICICLPHMLTNQPKSRNECDVSWTCDVWTRTARCMRRKMSVMCVCFVAIFKYFSVTLTS